MKHEQMGGIISVLTSGPCDGFITLLENTQERLIDVLDAPPEQTSYLTREGWESRIPCTSHIAYQIPTHIHVNMKTASFYRLTAPAGLQESGAG